MGIGWQEINGDRLNINVAIVMMVIVGDVLRLVAMVGLGGVAGD